MTDVTDEEIWCKACSLGACEEEQWTLEACEEGQWDNGASEVTEIGHLEQKK